MYFWFETFSNSSGLLIFRHFYMFSCFYVVFIVVVLCDFVRYPLKVRSDNKSVDQKIYFGNGGVFTTVIQPNPTKSDQVRRFFIVNLYIAKWKLKECTASHRVQADCGDQLFQRKYSAGLFESSHSHGF